VNIDLRHVFLFTWLSLSLASAVSAEPWKMHVIDNTSRGADGVKLADVNGDRLLDIATGWEEGGQIRLYIQPDRSLVKQPWPAVTVGKVKSPEDAFFADVNGDGKLDIVSCCEGNQQTLFVHLCPIGPAQLLKSSAWETQTIVDSQKKTRWMFGQAAQFDEDLNWELLCGSKDPHGQIGWYDPNAENPADANWHPIGSAGWIMTLDQVDIDLDGDLDIYYSDRKGPRRGCWCRINPGDRADPASWQEIAIGGQGQEVMFLTTCDANHDGLIDFVCPVKNGSFEIYLNVPPQSKSSKSPTFKTVSLLYPENVGTAKCARLVDVDLDHQLDLIATCEHAEKKHGVYWLSGFKLENAASQISEPVFQEISGSEQGIKYDLIEMVDLDADGDLDLLTCEERDNLGVIWYENPSR